MKNKMYLPPAQEKAIETVVGTINGTTSEGFKRDVQEGVSTVGKVMRFGYIKSNEFSNALEQGVKSTSKKAQDRTDANERQRKGSMREDERQREGLVRERAFKDLEARHNRYLIALLDRRLIQGDINATEHAVQFEKQYASQSDETAKLEAAHVTAQAAEVIGE